MLTGGRAGRPGAPSLPPSPPFSRPSVSLCLLPAKPSPPGHLYCQSSRLRLWDLYPRAWMLGEKGETGHPCRRPAAHRRVRGPFCQPAAGSPYSSHSRTGPSLPVWTAGRVVQCGSLAPPPTLVLTISYLDFAAAVTAGCCFPGMWQVLWSLPRHSRASVHSRDQEQPDQDSVLSTAPGKAEFLPSVFFPHCWLEAHKCLLGAWPAALSRTMEFSRFPCSFSLSSAQVWGCGHGPVETVLAWG